MKHLIKINTALLLGVLVNGYGMEETQETFDFTQPIYNSAVQYSILPQLVNGNAAWTDDKDQQLYTAVMQLGDNWESLSQELFPSNSANELYLRFWTVSKWKVEGGASPYFQANGSLYSVISGLPVPDPAEFNDFDSDGTEYSSLTGFPTIPQYLQDEMNDEMK